MKKSVTMTFYQTACIRMDKVQNVE